jgi:hypothetical protein
MRGFGPFEPWDRRILLKSAFDFNRARSEQEHNMDDGIDPTEPDESDLGGTLIPHCSWIVDYEGDGQYSLRRLAVDGTINEMIDLGPPSSSRGTISNSQRRSTPAFTRALVTRL